MSLNATTPPVTSPNVRSSGGGDMAPPYSPSGSGRYVATQDPAASSNPAPYAGSAEPAARYNLGPSRYSPQGPAADRSGPYAETASLVGDRYSSAAPPAAPSGDRSGLTNPYASPDARFGNTANPGYDMANGYRGSPSPSSATGTPPASQRYSPGYGAGAPYSGQEPWDNQGQSAAGGSNPYAPYPPAGSGPMGNDTRSLVGDRYAGMPSSGGAGQTSGGPPLGDSGGYRPGSTSYVPGQTDNPPGRTDYQPGDTGYHPPGVAPYQVPGGLYNPSGSVAEEYRPGSTSRYVPRSQTPAPSGGAASPPLPGVQPSYDPSVTPASMAQ